MANQMLCSRIILQKQPLSLIGVAGLLSILLYLPAFAQEADVSLPSSKASHAATLAQEAKPIAQASKAVSKTSPVALKEASSGSRPNPEASKSSVKEGASDFSSEEHQVASQDSNSLPPEQSSPSQQAPAQAVTYKESPSILSTAYLLKVFGALIVLLGAFYLLAKFWLRDRFSPALQDFASKESRAETNTAKDSWLKMLFANPVAEVMAAQPRILSRLRLGPTKEIYILQVKNRQLLIGATPNNISLLADLTTWEPVTEPTLKTSPSPQSEFQEQLIYQKYVSPGSHRDFNPDSHPEVSEILDEEVVYLEDYEDHYEHPSI